MPSTVIPCLRYRNAPAAINWLCEVIGFERGLIVPGPDDTIAHAQLKLGDGMIMLGSVKDDEFGRLIQQPDSIAGNETQCPHVAVSDEEIEHVYARALAKGAPIVRELRAEDYGGKNCGFRDLEGHVWSVGSYDPWA